MYYYYSTEQYPTRILQILIFELCEVFDYLYHFFRSDSRLLGKNSKTSNTSTELYLYSYLAFQSKTMQLVCLFICLMLKFKGLQSQEIITITETTFCCNSSLKGQYILRANFKVKYVRDAACMIIFYFCNCFAFAKLLQLCRALDGFFEHQ